MILRKPAVSEVGLFQTLLPNLQQFLGVATYYRKFIKYFATIAYPLHRLTSKNTPWKWTGVCGTAFSTLKRLLMTAPVLAFPVFIAFILDTDESMYGIGAVLSQKVGTTERVIAYASRVLTKSERQYCATRRGMLALVWNIRHCKPYLFGCKFLAHTDHNSLKWLSNFKQFQRDDKDIGILSTG